MLKSKKLISIALTALFIFPMLFASVPIVPIVKATAPITQIGLCIDGSGSISSNNWNIIKSGIANAVQNIIPKDGSIELTIVQFGGTTARVELYPTTITASNVGSVVATINVMSKIGGTTPMAAGLSLTWNTMRNSPNFDKDKKQIINIVTDGNPNVPSPSSYARSLVISARNTAVSQGLDELDAEAIGTNVNINWLRDYVVYPQPGSIVSVSTPTPWPKGWVLPISSFTDFPVAISKKFEVVIPPQEVKLEIVKSAYPLNGSSVNPGQTITYTITYGNTGSANATNVVIIDAIPTHTTYFTGSASGTSTIIEYSHDGGLNWDASDSAPVTHIKWTRATLTAGTTGQTVSFKVTVNSVPDGTTISNKASIDSDGSNTVTHTVTKPPCTCEDVLKAVLDIENKLDEGGFFWTFVNNWFTDIEGKLWSWENSVKNDTMAIWTLKNNIHGWANLTVALDDIKSEIVDILDKLGKKPDGSTGTIWGDINRIWSLTNNKHGWANLTDALDDIKNEIEGIDGGATVSITKLDVRVPEQGDVGESEWGKIWDLCPDSTNDLFFFLIVTRADNGQPVTGLTSSNFSVTWHDKDHAATTKSLTVANVTESGGVYRIVVSSNNYINDWGVLSVVVSAKIDSKPFTGTILIAVKK